MPYNVQNKLQKYKRVNPNNALPNQDLHLSNLYLMKQTNLKVDKIQTEDNKN